MSIKKSLIITALSVFLLGGAAQAFAKTVVVHAPGYDHKAFVVYVNGHDKTCTGYGAGNGWQNTRVNVNPGDTVMVVFYHNGCFDGKAYAVKSKKVPNDKLKYFWFKM